jgi:hypothetical protein
MKVITKNERTVTLMDVPTNALFYYQGTEYRLLERDRRKETVYCENTKNKALRVLPGYGFTVLKTHIV